MWRLRTTANMLSAKISSKEHLPVRMLACGVYLYRNVYKLI
jgi:hypothetical protein